MTGRPVPERTNGIESTWVLAGGLCLLFIMTRQFVADFWDNEWVYSLGPLKILDAPFLANDFYMDKVYPFFLVYDTLAAPFFLLFDALTATLVLRVLIWIFQIWALLRLLKTLGVTWWGSVLFFGLWLNAEQTLAAGEWIFGCASAKPIAYGFIFLSLDSALRGDLRWSGAFCGLAIAVHILVGLWFGAALGVALIFAQPRREMKVLWNAGLLAALCSLPGLSPALYAEAMTGGAGASAGTASEVARLSVLLANPIHLDPVYFMGGVEYLKVVLVFGATLGLLRRGLAPDAARLLTALLTCLALFFVMGLVARYGEWYRLLKYYPFRVADALVPWAFWVGVVLAFQRLWARPGLRRLYLAASIPLMIGIANVVLKDVLEPRPRDTRDWSSLVTGLARTEPRLTAYWVRERGKEWYTFVFGQEVSDRDDMAQWVSAHTPEDGVFITPPWERSFQLKARRAQFVNFSIPVSARIFEWKARFEAINRGPLKTVGREMWLEIEEHYPQLTSDELRRIKERYRVDYVLMHAGSQLDLELVHENASYRLYRF